MTAGCYIAHHPWLDIVGGKGLLFKVGHSGDLARRIVDGAYTTCYPEGWEYVATFETKTKEEAEQIETAVLYCCADMRLGNRELVQGKTLDALKTLAVDAAIALNITIEARDMPRYVLNRPARADGVLTNYIKRKVAHLKGETDVELFIQNAAEERTDAIEAFIADIWRQLPVERYGAPKPQIILAAEPDDLGDNLDIEDAEMPVVIEERAYQTEAIAACVAELSTSGKAILQMACRCGKTKVAWGVITDYIARLPRARIGYIVPSLSLLRQTVAKLMAYGANAADILLVGSDPVEVVLPSGGSLAMTTDQASVDRFLAVPAARIVISMYQSSQLLALNGWNLLIFDEAHRTCGKMQDRPFNYMLLHCEDGDRLFMTATPSYEGELNMKDKEIYGGIAYRYYLREAVDNKYVNDFRLELIAGASGGKAMPEQIITAMMSPGMDKLLVFCRDIKSATDLCAKTAEELVARKDCVPFVCLTAHSRMSKAAQLNVLKRLNAEGVRAVMFNVRLLQEGTEVPRLNGVFFAAPRHSSRDIIQSFCRALNYIKDKPQSAIFLPIEFDKTKPAEDLANLGRFASIVPVFDALAAEDSKLFEYLLNPKEGKYPISCLGTKSLGITSLVMKNKLLAAVKRAVRFGTSSAARPVDRLTRSENIPWALGFGALENLVVKCNRYPKTVDALKIGEIALPFYRLYQYYVAEYQNFLDGKKCALEPMHLRALESLPCWLTYGMEGPYLWSEAMQTLEKWLEENDGEPPMLDVHQGGYIGLDATPLERLSGAMTVINQQTYSKKGKDGKVRTHLEIDELKAKDLDRIHEKWGDKLRWRKELREDGLIDETRLTWIQESYNRFKEYRKTNGATDEWIQWHFSGFPLKHKRMECPQAKKEDIPPRWKPQKKKAQEE